MDGLVPKFIWAAQMGLNQLFLKTINKKKTSTKKNEVERGWVGLGGVGVRIGAGYDQNTLQACMKFSRNNTIVYSKP